MHVASVAANAIVELFRDRAVSRVKELDREVLVFSISHDYVNVKIHGHYARTEGDKITLHRHLIRSFDLRDQNGKEKWTTYHIVRKIYDKFAPIHLERIRGAVAKLSVGSSFGLSSASLELNPEGDRETEADSQERTEGAASSQSTERAKKPRLKPTAILQQEIDYLKNERQESRPQLAQERKANERRRQQMNSQLNTLITQLDQQRKESREQLERQREESKEQLEHYKEIIKMLKQQASVEGRGA